VAARTAKMANFMVAFKIINIMGEEVIEIRKCEIEDTYLQFARGGIWRARCDHATVDVVEIQKWVVGTWNDGQTRCVEHQSTVRPSG
jgi:hypothetical protein